MHVQSVLLRKDKMTLVEARRWVRDHDYYDNKIDITDRFYRFRQHEPLPFMRYRTIELKDIGELIVAYG